MTQATKIIGKVRQSVQRVAYGNPLYHKILASGETPQHLPFTPDDPWPGDANAGMTLLSEQSSMFDMVQDTSLRNTTCVLRNLRAVGTDAARHACIRYIDTWLQQYDRWDQDEWEAENLGARIAAWIGFYNFFAPAADGEFVQKLIQSLHRQFKHLERTVSTSLKGIASIQASRGLIYGGLNFCEGEASLGLACDLLQKQLAAEILSDGAHVSRNPSVQLHMLRHLVDIRNVLEMAEIRMPASIGVALASLIPGLKFFRHGDGGLALFHGSVEESSLIIDSVLTQAVVRGRILSRLPACGYERLTAGRGLLFVDTGAPPPRAYGQYGHAGLSGFEFSTGKERIIVNCGEVPNGSIKWRQACASTAAHSTLTIADTNACDVDEDGGVNGRVQTSSQRFEDPQVCGIELAHDGYQSRFGLMFNRVLKLAKDGEALYGCDVLQGKKGKDYSIRWHLHPSVQASLSQGGQTALLKTPSGTGWRMRVENGDLGLEPSIYCGNAVPRRTMQLKTSGTTEDHQTIVKWSLIRERKS